MNKIDNITMRMKAYAIRTELNTPLESAMSESRFFAQEVNRMIADGYSDEEIRLILRIYRLPVVYLAL